MNILLLQYYEYREPRTPIALMDLAAYGRKFGHSVDIGYVEDEHDFTQYAWVGFSAMDLCQEVRASVEGLRRRCYIPIVFGGKAVNAMCSPDCTWLANLGVEIHKGSGEFFFNGDNAGPISKVSPIDYENYPAWEKADFDKINKSPSMVEMMSSRGCPYKCRFCNNTEPKVSYFSVERTVRNASLLLNTFARPYVFLVDDIFSLRNDRMLAILEAADKEGLNLRRRTMFFVHASHLTDRVLDAIDALQPREMQMGVESGDDGMLAAMDKTFTSAQAEERLRELKRRGHLCACLFLMGFPGETRESLQNTVEWAKRNRQYMSGPWVSLYQPIPNTVGWEMAREWNPDFVTGRRNTEITYLDPNITREDLIAARAAVMTP